MSNYHFKQWLSFDDAVSWLSDHTDMPFSVAMLETALTAKIINVHAWALDRPEIHVVGNFDEAVIEKLPSPYLTEAESRPSIDISLLTDECIFEGPIPLQDYEFFKTAMQRNTPNPLGITVFDGQGRTLVCYPLKDDDIASFSDERIAYLFHLNDLKAFAEKLPSPPQASSVLIKYLRLTLSGTDQSYVEASSNSAGNAPLSWDLPGPASETTETERQDDEPALRALGFATHLLAELSAELDEKEKLPGRRLDFQRGGKPNVSRIADALADMAKSLRHDGHGVQGAGFKKILAQALDTVK